MNRRRTPLTHFLGLLALGVGLLPAPSTLAAASRVDFSREIRPILSDKCFACHGPDDRERKGKLRFDHRDSATQPAKSGAIAIVPGKPEDSELIKRVVTHDADDLMPPAKSGKTVTPRQIELLRQWIAEGAEFKEHWAFVPPQRPPVPAPASGNPAPEHPIDAFVRERLKPEGLQPAPEADRPTLARRVTLDLTGLPPTPEELDAYLADTSPKAYEKLVDRLLESPRFGERMAVEWLDAARYADTHGYHLDSGRDMTAWRDWVIRAFNDNKPFDQFTVEQLAGDLLPDATDDQKIGSGFNRNHMINYEGGAIAEEYHYAYLVDRVNTTSTTWLGVSMACAQCHDHKYDPLSRSDFYRLLAFFNNVPERGLDGNRGNASPVLKLATPEQKARLAELQKAVDAGEKRLAGPLPDIDASQTQWESTLASTPASPWKIVEPTSALSSVNARLRSLDDKSLLVSGENPAKDVYTLTFDPPASRLTALRLEALPDDSLPGRGPGRAGNGNFVLSTVRLSHRGTPIALKEAKADFSQNGYPIAAVLDDNPQSGWAVDGGIGKPHQAVFELATPLETSGPLTVSLEFKTSYANHALGRFRLSATDTPGPRDVRPVPEEFRAIAAKPAADRSDDEKARLRKYYREQISPEHRQLREALASARKTRDEFDAGIPTTMIMGELEKPRDTFIRMRGQYDQLGDKVTAGVPAALPPLPTGAPSNRLGLARWLVSPDQPLTARVIVNRYWQMFFGIGLVRTAEDFGSQGEWPSHPELLDWLAREFMDSGWNVKRLQRLILTSATYRQSARVSEELHRRDPENRLLARGPRFRLQAEFIRDQALAVSGLLNPVIGGKSVSPYQPQGLWEELSMREDSRNFSAQFFVQSKGPDLYRRSMYTFWKRSSPPPQMSTFDAPDRETCTVRRPRTNTPLQALVLLNDPTYVEASRKLAERLLQRTGTDADRITWAFRLATARVPTDAERAVMLRVLEQQRAHYRAHRDAAESLLSNGEATRDLTLDAAELAAWTMVSSTLLNLDETVTRG
jgi:hypothetical protein